MHSRYRGSRRFKSRRTFTTQTKAIACLRRKSRTRFASSFRNSSAEVAYATVAFASSSRRARIDDAREQRAEAFARIRREVRADVAALEKEHVAHRAALHEDRLAFVRIARAARDDLAHAVDLSACRRFRRRGGRRENFL